MSGEALKPCPFCGCKVAILGIGDELIDHPGKRLHGYTCWKCLAHVPGGLSPESALRAWNQRNIIELYNTAKSVVEIRRAFSEGRDEYWLNLAPEKRKDILERVKANDAGFNSIHALLASKQEPPHD